MPKPNIPDTFIARKKGDVITQSEITALIGYGPTHAKYSLLATRLADGIMKIKSQADQHCVVVQQKSDLKILTDIEASAYNRRTSDGAVRALRRSHRRQCEVKVERFTDKQREEHDRHLAVAGARVALTGASLVNQVARMSPHQRITPSSLSYRKV